MWWAVGGGWVVVCNPILVFSLSVGQAEQYYRSILTGLYELVLFILMLYIELQAQHIGLKSLFKVQAQCTGLKVPFPG